MQPNQPNQNQQKFPIDPNINQNIPPQQSSYYGGNYPQQQLPPGNYPYPNQNIPGNYPYPYQNVPGQYPYPYPNPPGNYPVQNPPGNQNYYPCPPQGAPVYQNIPPGGIPPQQGYAGYPPQQGQPYPPQYSQFPTQTGYASQPCGIPSQPCGIPPQPCAVPPQQTIHVNLDKNKKNKVKFVQVGPSTPSLRPIINADPLSDARTIYGAFKGIGCDNRTVINILARRSVDARENIKTEYNKLYDKNIVERAKSEFYEPLERLIVSLLLTREHLDAYLLRKATKGIGTDESALIDILVTRSSFQISKIKESYIKQFKYTLEKHISSDTSGSFKEILLKLINCPRDQSEVVDQSLAQKDASEMYSRKLIKINAPSSLIDIFCLRSYAHLRTTFNIFQQQYGISVYSFLKQYSSGWYESTLMAICNFVVNPLHYQSKQLRIAINNLNINTIIRIVCTRCEVDLLTIIQDYQFMYKKDAFSDIKQAFEANHPDTVYALSILMGR